MILNFDMLFRVISFFETNMLLSPQVVSSKIQIRFFLVFLLNYTRLKALEAFVFTDYICKIVFKK